MSGYIISIPTKGWFYFWGLSTGKRLQVTDDKSVACFFYSLREAETCARMLNHLLDRSDIAPVGYNGPSNPYVPQD